MGPVTPVFRALAAVLVGAGVLLGAAPAPAAEAAPTTTRAEVERAVFTGTFVRAPVISIDGAAPVRRYQVAVDLVYGEGSVTTQRVTVRARIPLESCGLPRSPGGQSQTGGAQQEQATPGQPSEPSAPTTTPSDSAPTTTIDKRQRVFVGTRDGADYVVTSCKDVSIVDAATIATLEERFGEGREPGAVEQPTQPLEEVGYLCPDTRDTVDLDDRGSCEALQDDQSFDRAAAPGLALVIVGVLGLLVVRRIGRRRTF